MPWVDSVIGIGDYSQLTTCASSEKIPTQAYLDVPQKYSSRISAYVPISQGCDNFCTYCVVPFSRGKEVHRPAVDIRRQVETLVGADCKLITLLGQNVTSWKGRVENREASFPALLRYITAVNGKYWLTYLTAHPKDVTMKLLDVLVDCGDKVCSYINLPMQSGSPAVLARMNRGYTVDEYVRKVEMLRAAVPDMRVSTDIIVGFPGETEEEFEETYNLMQDIQFSMAYVAEYSSRKGAASSLLEDSVPVKVKKERKMRIENLQRSIIEKKNAQSVGSHADVLVKTSNSGVTHDLREVRFEKDVSESIGNIVQSLVVGSSASGLLCRTPV